MDEIRYKIVLDGVPLPNVTPQTLQANLARLFKISQDKAKQLMGKAGIVVKRNLSDSEANRYLYALQKAGAVSRKEAETASTTIKAPAQRQSPDDAQDTVPHLSETPQTPSHEEHMEEFVLLNPYSTHGRIGRLRYFAWMSVIIFSLLAAFAPVMAGIYFIAGTSSISITACTVLGTLAFLLLSFFSICATSQRLHDIGYSTWLVLIGFIPIINWVFSFVLCFIPGEKEKNTYGIPPPENSKAVYVLTAAGAVFLLFGLMGATVISMLQ